MPAFEVEKVIPTKKPHKKTSSVLTKTKILPTKTSPSKIHPAPAIDNVLPVGAVLYLVSDQ